jgi:hypothetical protein
VEVKPSSSKVPTSLVAIIAPPSRRLSGGRDARRAEGEDAPATAGKMPALL